MSSEPRSNDPMHRGLVVGIGASAGGLAAFKTFLANTPVSYTHLTLPTILRV